MLSSSRPSCKHASRYSCMSLLARCRANHCLFLVAFQRAERPVYQGYSGSILEYTYHLILGLLFAVLIKIYRFGPVASTSLKHCTGLWLLAQAALPAITSPTGPLRDNTLPLHTQISCTCKSTPKHTHTHAFV